MVAKYYLSTHELVWFKNIFLELTPTIPGGLEKGLAIEINQDDSILVALFKRGVATDLFLTFHYVETGELLFPVQQLTSD